MTIKKNKKQNKSIYNPKLSIGTPIFYLKYIGNYDCVIAKTKVTSIVFTEYFNDSHYEYNCSDYSSFTENEIGVDYFLTRKEAKKALKKLLKEEEKKRYKQIEIEYLKAKKEYEKLKGKKIK